jgi:putative redox protein
MKAHLAYRGTGYTLETQVRHHRFIQDSSSPGGADLGPSPKEYLLSAIIGCTAMDVVAMLKKHRIEYSALEVTADAEQTASHPRVFEQVDLIYEIVSKSEAPSVSIPVLIDAVEKSMTLYCGVSAMQRVPLFYTVRLDGELIHRGQAKFSA